jgi:hypothetical protein
MKNLLNFFLIFVILLTPLISSGQTLRDQSIALTKMEVSPCAQKVPINLKGQCNTGQTYVETNLLELLIPSLLMALISFTYLVIFSIGVRTSIYKPPRYSPIFI